MDYCFREGQSVALLANAFTVAIAKNLTPDEENILGNLFTLIGASLLSIAAIDQTSESSEKTSAKTAAR